MIPVRHATRRLLAFVAIFAIVSMVGAMRPAAALASWPLVRNGDNGANVKTVQFLLLHRGYSVTADGAFGPATETAVKSFQTANALTADGIVGAGTWSKLVVTLDVGANNNAVKGLQTQLNKNGYSLTVDGAFGAGTQSAVLDFKNKHFLGSGSTVGPTTWQELTGSGNGGGTSGGYSLPLAKSLLPRTEYDDPHHDYPAIDLAVGTGTAVYAVKGGTATRINDSGCGYGYSVSATDGAVYTYCHFSSFSAASGATVNTGQLLGYSGNTGNSTGPHLHLGLRVNGVSRCPQNLLIAIYDGTTVPAPSSLPTTGCFY